MLLFLRHLIYSRPMKQILPLTLVLAATATLALAHAGVKDPDVMARMEGMKAMGAAEKTLRRMSRGQITFDATEAQAAREVLAREAPRVVPLFEPQADDPLTEALPTIWTAFDDFAEHAEALEQAVANLDVSSLGRLQATLRPVGQACGTCHDAYVKD